uniref:Secreted protein n=1 Tax=Mesocestoides corti TaxID=53468 RepID=A0A5K3FGW8_MESCO
MWLPSVIPLHHTKPHTTPHHTTPHFKRTTHHCSLSSVGGIYFFRKVPSRIFSYVYALIRRYTTLHHQWSLNTKATLRHEIRSK